MKLLVTGSHGLVGSPLTEFLEKRGNEVYRLVRRESPSQKEISYDYASSSVDAPGLEGFDAVIHLAGENIGEGRWTDEKKKKIRESRVEGTSNLVRTLLSLGTPPPVFLSASAMGYYGDRGEEILTEDSGPGAGFLAEVCRDWEAAAEPLNAQGIRVLHLRSGLILSPRGGALSKMLLPFKFGVGGKIGSGRQYWSWVVVDDWIRIVEHLLLRKDLSGPVNVGSPNPVRNSEFTAALGKVMRRPALIPLPAFAARAVLGEMANDLLLSSTRMKPAKLLSSEYSFLYPDLQEALFHVVG